MGTEVLSGGEIVRVLVLCCKHIFLCVWRNLCRGDFGKDSSSCLLVAHSFRQQAH